MRVLLSAVWLFWLVVLAVSGADLAINGAHPQLGLVSLSSGDGARHLQLVIELFSVLTAVAVLAGLALRLRYTRPLTWLLALLCLAGGTLAVLAALVIGLPRAPFISFAVLLASGGLLTAWAAHLRLRTAPLTSNSVAGPQAAPTDPA